MIGLDTNVVVRYLVQDDPAQAQIATELIEALTEADPGYLGLVTIVEVSWVLRRAYGVDAGRCSDLIDGILTARELRVESDEIVRRALVRTRAGADFADAVIAEQGIKAGCERTVTFDRRAARGGMMHLLGAAEAERREPADS